jgi:hypothetical protein
MEKENRQGQIPVPQACLTNSSLGRQFNVSAKKKKKKKKG